MFIQILSKEDKNVGQNVKEIFKNGQYLLMEAQLDLISS